MLSLEDFNFVTGLVYRETGISLGRDKGYLVETRLGELSRTLGIGSVEDLIKQVRQRPDTSTRNQLVGAMTTNETTFFRDRTPFDALKSLLLPTLIDARRSKRELHFWSAACSTGQEPYSVAMLLQEAREDLLSWNVKILASDITDRVLERARQGVYSQMEVNRGLPPNFLQRYFKPHAAGHQINASLRSMVDFSRLNLMALPARMGPFDVIFCRNVLIYFDAPTKERVLDSLCQQLAPDGYLFLGSSEVILGISDKLRRVTVGGTVCYQKIS